LLQVDVIEAGFPAASANEAGAVRAVASEVGSADGPVICALARATRSDIEVAARSLEPARRRRLHTFIATSDLHLERKLKLTRAQAVERAAAAVTLAREITDDVEFSAEDASRSDPDFLTEVFLAAIAAGARTLNVPDTVGWSTPSEYGELIQRVCRIANEYPDVVVSTHCHDDLGLAVANTLAGISAGARQVECVVNGLGERAGNAALEEIVMALHTRPAFYRVHTRVNTCELANASRVVSECTCIPVPATKAVVGANAFAHESGIHQAGVLADRRTYEIIEPTSVGVAGTTLVLGKHSGRHALAHRLEALGLSVADDIIDRISGAVKELAESHMAIDDATLASMVQRSIEQRQRETHPRTMLEKVWDAHVVRDATPDTPAVIYVDLHLVHEVTSAQAFSVLRERGLRVRCPERTLATMDHATPTTWSPVWSSSSLPARVRSAERGRRMLALCDDDARTQLEALATNAKEAEIPVLPLGDPRRGIVHVVGPELGLTQPGMVVVCGDSHTSTHGAFGALAFGIGTTQVAHVLATQCLLQQRPKVMRVEIAGTLHPGVTAKDLALALAARIGIGGATGHVIEYAGPAVRALSMEGRMTLCNMAIEVGARAGMVAPDETTIEYVRGRPGAPEGADWDAAVVRWMSLASEVRLDANEVEPMVTYGTNPGMAVSVTGRIPELSTFRDETTKQATVRALGYMGLVPGAALAGTPVDVVFVGSCTNSRLSDLRAVAGVLRGRQVAPGVRLLVVPGSEVVKRDAEAEGLHRVFLDAGAEWREPGCSMCIAMNGDKLAPRQLAVSTSNRNFEGRQGTGGRTVLASPVTAAAAAVAGAIVDPRPFLQPTLTQSTLGQSATVHGALV
jgi:3-isopropylmalate/(R)-2-methylmalate dehydratase large subunit